MSLNLPLYWISRTLPAAETTAQKLTALGCPSLIDPVLTVEALTPPLDTDGLTDIIFTSPNGVAAFCAAQSTRRLRATRQLTVWAVGTATADSARAQGFTDIHDADGDGGDLSRLIIAKAQPSGHYLYAGPETPARDIAGALKAANRRFTQAAFYRTTARRPDTALRRLTDISHILIHSPRAGRLIGQYLKDRAPFTGLRVLCISEAAAHSFAQGLNRMSDLGTGLDLHTGNLSGLGIHIEIADHPSETALLQRIGP